MRSRSQVDEGAFWVNILIQRYDIAPTAIAPTAGSTEDLAPPVLQPQTSTTTTPLCSICLDTVENAVETNCGHRFCAQCILMHWNRDRYPQPCRCPNCRRDVCEREVVWRSHTPSAEKSKGLVTSLYLTSSLVTLWSSWEVAYLLSRHLVGSIDSSCFTQALYCLFCFTFASQCLSFVSHCQLWLSGMR